MDTNCDNSTYLKYYEMYDIRGDSRRKVSTSLLSQASSVRGTFVFLQLSSTLRSFGWIGTRALLGEYEDSNSLVQVVLAEGQLYSSLL